MAITAVTASKNFIMDTLRASIVSFDHDATTPVTLPADLPTTADMPTYRRIIAIFILAGSGTAKVHQRANSDGTVSVVYTHGGANNRPTILIIGE